MKALRILLIILGVIVAAMLIVPLFAPATVKVQAEKVIDLRPSQVFDAVASFRNRAEWDPWVEMDTTTVVNVESKEGYVGSTYVWEGEQLGTGKMEVLSVEEDTYIESSLWFGDVATPSKVEWTFEPENGGTKVVWSFSEETTYPFGRLRMMIGKVFLKQSFEQGLANLKEYLEANPPPVGSLGPVSIQTQDPMVAMVAEGSGTMDNISEDMGRIFGLVMAEVEKQNLQIAGTPFANYLDYDETTGITNYVAGIPVVEAGVKSGEVVPVVYNEMRVAKAIHKGPYTDLPSSYKKMYSYLESKGEEMTGESFEFYLTDPTTESDDSKWETAIAFVLE